jgi:hypothetical protein
VEEHLPHSRGDAAGRFRLGLGPGFGFSGNEGEKVLGRRGNGLESMFDVAGFAPAHQEAQKRNPGAVYDAGFSKVQDDPGRAMVLQMGEDPREELSGIFIGERAPKPDPGFTIRLLADFYG